MSQRSDGGEAALVEGELGLDTGVVLYFISSPPELYYLSQQNDPLTLSATASQVFDIYYEAGEAGGRHGTPPPRSLQRVCVSVLVR